MAFFMALSGANTQYGYQYFGQREKEPVLIFCQKMGCDLIYNRWVPEDHSATENCKKKLKAVKNPSL